MSTALDVHTWELAEYGYTVLDGIRTDEEAAEALRAFGELVPQYDGSLRYQVKAAPGFEERRYSKSVNTILVHTEAPGWNPPPSYLALHCRVQATCGSGHTELADMRRFVDALSEKDRAALHERGIEWLGHNTGGVGTEGVLRPVVERTDSGQEILRFSYNLLTTGQYDPPVNASVDPAELPLGSFGVRLAEQAEEFFRQEKISVLIPEDSVLVWDNQRMVHARSAYRDAKRHLTRYWIAAQR
ncbi:TauD/TfdA family dioxygenase [Streptomyces sp. PTY087I2]|uniref:TauD/TfdA family dioxygenase n=1 Tax=Streptomyces sp. PTY087I2 TaxID=1819298 RepID=UPI00080B3606|nr:TauD/TfdA family dioxygenase [Streptomyces sp. PTY087I2]OCC10045.1 Taurine catabolism dioxygenase TauD, TfdA family [Streptomyces sp. PTY087I2]